MDTTQKGIVVLLRSAISGEALPLPDGFDLENAYSLINKHHISTLVYEGAVRCGISRQLPVMQNLFKSYCRLLLASESQINELERLCKAFDDSKIDYMPLKGSRMKAIYPKHELRYMGDADILIRVEQYDRIRFIMESLGFQEGNESDHEYVWRTKGLFLELHKRLIPSYNKDFYAYFGEGWQIAIPEQGTRYRMSAEDEMIYLFTHFAKHFRDGGIGCRYVVDLWVYRNANPSMDESYILSALKKLYLADFYENVLRLMDAWFGESTIDDKTDLMTDFIFSSGSWGSEDSKTVANAARGIKNSSRDSNRLAYIKQVLLLDWTILREKYKSSGRSTWSLPFVWIVRVINKVLFDRKALSKQKQRLSALKDNSAQERLQMLNYVGLDFNF